MLVNPSHLGKDVILNESYIRMAPSKPYST